MRHIIVKVGTHCFSFKASVYMDQSEYATRRALGIPDDKKPKPSRGGYFSVYEPVTDILDTLASVGYRVVSTAATGHVFVWTLEKEEDAPGTVSSV